mgnify:CR=1 FL=1
MMENKEWPEMLETIYLAFSRIFDGLMDFLNGIFGKDAE